MNLDKETPGQMRERLRQTELKNNPFGTFSDGINRSVFGNFADLVGGIGWKATGIIILIVIGFIIFKT